MRWLTTAVLAVLLAGLATFYYVYEIRQAPGREKAAAVKDHLWKELEGKDVEEIVVRKGDAETLRLKRAGGTWSLTAPVSATADARAADDLASSLATLRVEREIEANPQKPADFGLAPPAVEVTFKAKGQDHTVRLGAKSPSGVWAYAAGGREARGPPGARRAPEGRPEAAERVSRPDAPRLRAEGRQDRGGARPGRSGRGGRRRQGRRRVAAHRAPRDGPPIGRRSRPSSRSSGRPRSRNS